LGGSEVGGSVPLPVGVPVSVGRKGCDVIVSHKKVSSTHVLLTATAAGAALPARAKRVVASRGRLRRVRWLLLGSAALEESRGAVQNLGEPRGLLVGTVVVEDKSTNGIYVGGCRVDKEKVVDLRPQRISANLGESRRISANLGESRETLGQPRGNLSEGGRSGRRAVQ